MEARRFPPALSPGDAVALVAPAGVVDAKRVEGAVRLLESRGLRVLVRPDITARHRSLAGADDRRAEELRRALEGPDVRAVFLARGGYGSQRILDRILPAGTAEPRSVIGFSDNTALLNHLRKRFGWVAVHGPHPQAEEPAETDEVLACLGLFGPRALPAYGGLEVLSGARQGPIEAEVAGGCLSLVSSSVGTPYAVDCRGKILFLEETAEPVYRLDRMLHHLRASGTLDGAAAVVFGRVDTFADAPGEVGTVRELLLEFAGEVALPVVAGLPCGHTHPNRPLPLGPIARLDLLGGRLTYLEGAVRR
jgi:muramoyltetrapeptide carboxypeptidase